MVRVLPTSSNRYANIWNWNPATRRQWAADAGILSTYADRSFESLPAHVQRRFTVWGARNIKD